MMTSDEFVEFERKRDRLRRNAMLAADSILMEGCGGDADMLKLLTVDMAECWAAKTKLMLLVELLKKIDPGVSKRP